MKGERCSRRQLLRYSSIPLLSLTVGCTTTLKENNAPSSNGQIESALTLIEETERTEVEKTLGTDTSIGCDSSFGLQVGNEYYASAVCTSSDDDLPAEPSFYLTDTNSTTRIWRYSDVERFTVRSSGEQDSLSFTPELHVFNFKESEASLNLQIQHDENTVYTSSYTIQNSSGIELRNVVQSPNNYNIKVTTNGSTVDEKWHPTEEDAQIPIIVIRPNGKLLFFKFEYPCTRSPVGGSC